MPCDMHSNCISFFYTYKKWAQYVGKIKMIPSHYHNTTPTHGPKMNCIHFISAVLYLKIKSMKTVTHCVVPQCNCLLRLSPLSHSTSERHFSFQLTRSPGFVSQVSRSWDVLFCISACKSLSLRFVPPSSLPIR